MLVKKFKFKQEFLEIHTDENPESPREWDNMGTMVCSHKQYKLGDIQVDSEEDYKEAIKEAKIILPIFMYDHSGISISTRRDYPFNDEWDSGQVGVIFITEEKLKKEYGVKTITEEIIKQATDCLVGEVETYNQYLSGDVYGFEKFRLETCDHHSNHKVDSDSCWGFFGSDFEANGLFESTGHTAKEWQELENIVITNYNKKSD
ncbi:MAG: hypothetical protein ACRENO_08220 [Thermodesulfobacteriota bacterium]